MVSLRCIIALFYELLMEVSNHGKVKERRLHTHPLSFWQGALPSVFSSGELPSAGVPCLFSLGSGGSSALSNLLGNVQVVLVNLILIGFISLHHQPRGGRDSGGCELDELLLGDLHRPASRLPSHGQGDPDHRDDRISKRCQKQTISDSCFQVTYNRMEHDKMLPLATECEARTNMLSRK